MGQQIIKKPIYDIIIENELPVNIISLLIELHKNGGRLNYGTGNFPVSISDSINKDWNESFKKVPRYLYYLFINGV